MTKTISKILLVIVVILTIVLAFKILKPQNIILKKIYVLEYSEYVYKYAEEFDVEPLLIFSIIKAESNFEKAVVSSSGAIGLMQLMESTGEEMAKKVGIKYETDETLYDPEKNIMLGTKYFSELLSQYDQNIMLALTAYNAGIGNVKRWIDDGTISSDGTDIENIPYKETNNYVRRALRNYSVYKELYE